MVSTFKLDLDQVPSLTVTSETLLRLLRLWQCFLVIAVLRYGAILPPDTLLSFDDFNLRFLHMDGVKVIRLRDKEMEILRISKQVFFCFGIEEMYMVQDENAFEEQRFPKK
jgi:hypothetical protein